MVRARGVLLKSLVKNVGCPCCNGFRGLYDTTSIGYCMRIDDDGT